MAKKQNNITVDDLRNALKSGDLTRQFVVFDSYCRHRPSIDAVPFLRKGLRSKRFSVVRCAARALEKLGMKAAPALIDLRRAAERIYQPSDLPQAYPECLHALVAIAPEEVDYLLDLICRFSGLTNWVPISAGMSALQKLGTPKALALLKRIHAFWYSELNKSQQKQADKFLKPLK